MLKTLSLFSLFLTQAALADPVSVPLIAPTPTPDVSLSAKQERVVKFTQNFMGMGVRSLKMIEDSIFQEIWHNPEGLTPQQAMDAYGSSCTTLRALFIQIKAMVNSQAPGTITVTEPKSVTSNSNGTCTVGE